MTMYRRYRYLLCVLMFTFILSGCAETPEEVKKEIAEIERAKEEEKKLKEELVYVPVSELQKDGRKNFSMDHGTFRFDGSIVIPECEDVYLLEMKVNDGMFQNIDENMPLIMKHIGKEEVDWKQYIDRRNDGSGNTYSEKGYCFVRIDDLEIDLDLPGWFSICKLKGKDEKFYHPYFLQGDAKMIDQYFLINDKETILDQEILLAGKKVTFRKLNDDFEKEMEFVNTLSPGLNLVPHDIRIYEDQETKDTTVVFRAQSNYKGIFFDANYIEPQDSKMTDGKSFVGFEMNQQMHHEGDRCFIVLREGSFIVSKEQKKLDKVIDFESALSLVEHTVPNDKITTIESAELMYQIYYEGDKGQNWELYYENPPAFYAAPVWRFVEKDRPHEVGLTVYYVDAVSGKVYSFYECCTP